MAALSFPPAQNSRSIVHTKSKQGVWQEEDYELRKGFLIIENINW